MRTEKKDRCREHFGSRIGRVSDTLYLMSFRRGKGSKYVSEISVTSKMIMSLIQGCDRKRRFGR